MSVSGRAAEHHQAKNQPIIQKIKKKKNVRKDYLSKKERKKQQRLQRRL